MAVQAPLPAALDAALRALVDEYRARCLWFLRPDLYPQNREQALRVLRHIERHGDREGFVRAAELREWLSPTSSERSAGIEWARDSAFRFFPLVEHPDLGLTLHPFDLATNKLLAAISRREARDWVDLVECDRRLQPLGYLAWAASGKDPAFGPAAIVEQVARSNRYSADELAELAFAGPPPDAAELSRRWHEAIDAARTVLAILPPEQVGTCVLLGEDLCRLGPGPLAEARKEDRLYFHLGSIGGALPTVRI